MPIADPVAEVAPARGRADARWAELPHDLLVRIFAAQPEPLHNLGAEYTCRAWSRAVRLQTISQHDDADHARRRCEQHVVLYVHA